MTLSEAAPAARAHSTLVSRNVTMAGHRTSIRLEPEMWTALSEICARERASLSDVVTLVGMSRSASSLTAAIRVFALAYFRAAATEEGHRVAGHGPAAGRRPTATIPSDPPFGLAQPPV